MLNPKSSMWTAFDSYSRTVVCNIGQFFSFKIHFTVHVCDNMFGTVDNNSLDTFACNSNRLDFHSGSSFSQVQLVWTISRIFSWPIDEILILTSCSSHSCWLICLSSLKFLIVSTRGNLCNTTSTNSKKPTIWQNSSKLNKTFGQAYHPSCLGRIGM